MILLEKLGSVLKLILEIVAALQSILLTKKLIAS